MPRNQFPWCGVGKEAIGKAPYLSESLIYKLYVGWLGGHYPLGALHTGMNTIAHAPMRNCDDAMHGFAGGGSVSDRLPLL